MEVNTSQLLERIRKTKETIKSLFIKKTSFSAKTELKLSAFKWLGLIFILGFVCIVLLMPDDIPVQFTET